MKRPLTEAANYIPDGDEKKQILKLIELFSDELDKTDPYICRMPVQTYQQFLRFCEISDKYKFLTNFENMVQVLEHQTEKESNEIQELKEIIEQKNYTISKLIEANKMLSDKVKEIEDSVYHIIPFTHFLVTRKIKKLSLRQVSKETGICISTISRFENGKDISLNNYIALRDFYMTIRIDISQQND